MTTEIERLERHVEFYKTRIDLLTTYQMRMRDPERTIVCDILANGALLPDPDGKRYGRIQQVQSAVDSSIDSEKTICVPCFRYHGPATRDLRIYDATCCIHHVKTISEVTRESKYLCTKWRENNAKDRIIHACEPDYIVRAKGDRE